MMILSWLRDRWYDRQRAFDLRVLWPQCCAQAKDLDEARMAFAVHAMQDPAWQALGRRNLIKYIDEMQPPA